MYDERTLIRECLAGNRQAERQLYESYSARFLGICQRYANSREEAEDMLVSGFMHIFSHLSEYKGKGSFEGWMKRLIISQAIDEVRKRKPQAASLSEAQAMADNESIPNPIARLEARDILNALRQLPETQRVIFSLSVIDGYAHREIARMFSMKEGTVRVNLHKAKKKLQTLLKAYE